MSTFLISVKSAEMTNFICQLKVKLDSHHKNDYIILFLEPKSIQKISDLEVIRCEIVPKASYFPSKLHKIIISNVYNSAPNLPIFIIYEAFLERIEFIDYHYCQRILII